MNFLIIIMASILLLISISLISKIFDKIKIPNVILYLFLGIILEILINGSPIEKPISELIGLIAPLVVAILFFNSGLSMNVSQLLKDKKITTKISIIPAHIEAIIMAGIMTLLFVHIMPFLGYNNIPFLGFLIISLAIGMSAPVIVVPECIRAKTKGYKDKIFDTMIAATLLDSFSVLPLLLFSFLIVGNSNSTLIIILGKVVLLLLSIVILIIIGYFVGKLLNKVIDIMIRKIKNINLIIYLIFIIVVLLVELLGPLKGMAIIFTMTMAIGLKGNIKEEQLSLLLPKMQKNYNNVLNPIIFIYVGIQLNIMEITNVKLLIILILLTLIATTLKGFLSSKIINKDGYSNKEQQFSRVSFFIKGVGLFNLAIILAPALIAAGYESLVNLMYIYGSVVLLLTFAMGIPKIKKEIDNWNS